MAESTCSIDGCDRPVRARGWCKAHYLRWQRTGSTGASPVRRYPRVVSCTIDGCGKPHAAKGLCSAHYSQLLRLGDPLAGKGDDIGYAAAHLRVKVARGPASGHPCTDCGGPAEDWSYRRDAKVGVLSPDGLMYSPSPEDYAPRCRPCHKVYDS